MSNIPSSSYSTQFICDPLLPTRELHLIAGGSGSGKSTLASQIAAELMQGGEFFGSPITTPQSIVYLAFDRSEEGMRRTFIRTLGETIPFPFYSTVTSKEFSLPELKQPSKALDHVRELHPDVDLIIVDGIGMAFTGDSSSLSEVAGFVHTLIRTLHRSPRPLTVIALHHMGKVKKGNEYAAARSRLHGSVAWAATAETCILIEPESEDDAENPNRRITVCPRNAPERIYTYAFDDEGRLHPASSPVVITEEQKAFLSMIPDEIELTTAQLLDLSTPLEISPATFKRWVSKLIEVGYLLKPRHGVYIRQRVQ